jgi:hypothetical protein
MNRFRSVLSSDSHLRMTAGHQCWHVSRPWHGASSACARCLPEASKTSVAPKAEPDHAGAVTLTNAGLFHAVLVLQHAGGFLLAYENDNVEGTDTQLITRLTKLTFIQEYPKGNNESTVMWMQRWDPGSNSSRLLCTLYGRAGCGPSQAVWDL